MSDKEIHEDQKYINGLLQNNSFIIQAIYDKFVPKVINYIKQNSGSAPQAKDIIQEVLITIYNQAQQKGLQLTCPFEAYFFLLCKRKWLNELKKNSNKEVTINEEVLSKDDDAFTLASETTVFGEQQELFNTMFQKLGDACKELLKATFKIKSMEEVAKSLNITYAYARKKKSLCIGKLTKLVQESPKFKQINTY
ncbi:RNA polymerase sigma factor [Bizionia paragorgiae]|jgi:RNA polymerase sigma factor (sigma-70 family)|uniref:RNA polymerase sigma factor, sigma-70 family n=1 Tax=Bizionia paragorgiae TaxID=283786 RepID=A0A1H4AYA2_BIZPA|nr:sigma-70 family RNA polymerase sigma factor [Bizionia paragorgiae]MDX1272205.1 sigma-70 family RNA polymerase sigma factor [Bizionia paragorgiae]SEA40845.1 RNA polymerase sigma factor, sigma-70 family [Bizionia paragorgiae]